MAEGECGGLTVMKAYCARLGVKVEEEELWWLVCRLAQNFGLAELVE